MCRSFSSRASSPRRYPEALRSPASRSSPGCVEANGSTCTRAKLKSFATSTAVTVTLPTRGSLTFRRSSVASVRCTCPAMRWVLADCLSIGLRHDPLLDRARHLDARITLDLIVDAHVLVVL